MKLKWSLLILAVFGSFVLNRANVYAQDTTNVYFFYGQGCPHCAKEHEFLNKLAIKDSSITLKEYEVWYSRENQELLAKVGKKLNVEVNGVPFVVIGDKYLVGYMSDETTGKEIERLILENKNNGCFDLFLEETGEENNKPAKQDPEEEECLPSEEIPQPVLPKFINLNTEKLSLPALTIVLGLLDGFNPCAMWTLLFLISLLIGMQNKKKMWVLGLVFIVSSAFVYFLFMVAWLKLFQFIGLIFWVRALIAVVAFAGGVASLKKFFSKSSSGCDVVGEEKRRVVFDWLERVTSNNSFILAIIGIIGLSFAVNLVELVCSAGLPAVYTQVLAMNKLQSVSYYFYILLYIFFFMIDDIVVFVVAMLTLEVTGITTKYVRFSRLIGGVLMLAIGVLLLVKPEVLMF